MSLHLLDHHFPVEAAWTRVTNQPWRRAMRTHCLVVVNGARARVLERGFNPLRR
jgi:hypothetical protein